MTRVKTLHAGSHVRLAGGLLTALVLVLFSALPGAQPLGGAIYGKAAIPLAAAPGAFSKISPVSGARLLTTSPTLHWQTSAGATSYEYCVQTRVWNSVPANMTCDGPWVATTSTSVHLGGLANSRLYGWQVRAVGAGGTTAADAGAWAFTAASSSVDLDGDRNGDFFVYNSLPGQGWFWLSLGNGQVNQAIDNFFYWDPDWHIVPGTFNADGITDFFLYKSGQWAIMRGDTLQTSGAGEPHGLWRAGWVHHVLDLDGDAISDVFLYDPADGIWFACLWRPSTETFEYVQGWWTTGWELVPMNLDGNDREDLFLLNRTTGQWFWALSDGVGGFSYPQTGFWTAGWALHQGDFTGDGLTDLLVHRPDTGQWCLAITGAAGFTYEWGAWTLGWTLHPADMNGDGRVDVLLHREDTGEWFDMSRTSAGTFMPRRTGQWSPDWQVHIAEIDRDGCADLIFDDRVTGLWHRAFNLHGSTLVYFQSHYNLSLPGYPFTVVAHQPLR